MAEYKFNLPVNSEQLKAVGMVTAEWSYLESIIDAAIWGMGVLSRDTGETVTTHLSISARLDMLATLFHSWHIHSQVGDKEGIKQLQDLLNEIRHSLSGKRGSVVHARWVLGRVII